jgi:hypothetical protein
MCNILATKSLPKRERAFVASVMQQVLHDPEAFQISERQLKWLKAIWVRRSQSNGAN